MRDIFKAIANSLVSIAALSLLLSGCGMMGGNLANNPDTGIGVGSFANPQWTDANPLANGLTLVYGLDFQDTITPLTDSLNSTKTLLFANFNNVFTNQNGGAYDGWKRSTMRRLGSNYFAYVSGNVTRVNAETYPSFSDIPNDLGRAALFGTFVAPQNNLIEVPDPFNGVTLDSGSFFVELWMKPAAYTASSKVVLSRWRDGNKSFMITYYHYNIAVFTSPDGLQTRLNATSGESVLKYGEWNHIAVAFSPSQMKIYINGALAQTFTSADGYGGVYGAAGEPLRIGQGVWGSAWMSPFEGKISALRVMNGVLNDTNAASNLRMSYGLYNKAAGVGPTGMHGFIDSGTADHFFRLLAEDGTYASNGYNYEFDWATYQPTDGTMGISHDFLATVDFQLQFSGSNRYHALLSKGWGPNDNQNGHFQLGVLVNHPRCILKDTAGNEYLFEDFGNVLANNVWYRMSLLVSGNTVTMQTKNLSTSAISTVTGNISGIVLNNGAGLISIGKLYARSGATHGYIDNVKIYKR